MLVKSKSVGIGKIDYIIRNGEQLLYVRKKNGLTMLENYKGIVSRELINEVIACIELYEKEVTHRSMMSNFVFNEEMDNLDENY